jgi:catechol 2,3-dioxygenase-like lactoylglutathione lyase family enzyme
MSTAIPARISIVTIGVADVERSVRFYEALGWERRSSSIEGDIAWFGTADSYLGIFGWDDLAEDAAIARPTRGSFGGITLAINVESREAVDAALEKAVAEGASILKPGTEFPFGYSGYFADPDGHPWEVCWNKGFPLGTDGRITIP